MVYDTKEWGDPTTANTVIQASAHRVDLQPLGTLLPGLSVLGEPLLANLDSTLLHGMQISRHLNKALLASGKGWETRVTGGTCAGHRKPGLLDG